MTPLHFAIQKKQGGVRAYPLDERSKKFCEQLDQSTLTIKQLTEFMHLELPVNVTSEVAGYEHLVNVYRISKHETDV